MMGGDMNDLPNIVPAAVTAFSPGGERPLLDFVPQHLAYLEHHGADGVLALGTNGEGVSMSMDERKEVLDAFLTHQGRLKVFAGTGCASLAETIELSRYAIERGADAVMIVPPFFFKQLTEEGLLAYYQEVLAALPAEKRVILYNIPSHSAVEITDELVDALVERFPERVLGIKDTSGDIERTRAFIKRYPQLAIYNGNDPATALAAEAGAAGAISGTANVFPDRVAAAWSARADGQDVGAAQDDLTKACDFIARFPAHSAIKHLLHQVASLPLTHVRSPLRDLTPAEAKVIELEAHNL
jgi:4-hydroxy-tetrahydrodipicolinate synthase